MKLKQHTLSAAYPAMQSHEYEALKSSIKNIGVQVPITLFEGEVIDGWHRYKAANELGMKCPSEPLGDVDPQDFAKSQSARRSLTQAQNAVAITAIYSWMPATTSNKNVTQIGGAAAAPPPKTNTELAEMAGTSVRTIQQAKTVHTKAVETVKDAVKSGAVSLQTAVAVAKLPAKEQEKVAAQGPKAMREAAKPKPATPEKTKPVHVEPEDAEYTGPSEAELQSVQASAKKDIDTVLALLESDDPKAELLKENERMRMELATVKSQRDGYMNLSNDLIRRVKSLRKMLDKAQGK